MALKRRAAIAASLSVLWSPELARAKEPERAPIDEVMVRGVKEPARSATLGREEVRQIPGTFGDPFRAVEVMPGVTPIVSGLPFFFVRGAPPGNVGYFVDGVRVPLLFHVGAGPSVVHPALIEEVSLYPGGYPARYGRYAGGIVAGETAPPSRTMRGETNLRLFDAGALVETPFAEGRGSALVGGRYSYTAAVLSLLSSSTVLRYWDYQTRIGYDLTPKDRVSVFAFGSYDFLGERTATETLTVFGTDFHRVDLRYDRRLGGKGKLRTAVTLGMDQTQIDKERSVRNRLVGIRTELEYELSSRARLRTGTDVQVDSYDVTADLSSLPPSQQAAASYFPSRTDISLGGRADVVLRATGRFEAIPGLRVDLFGSEGNVALAADPRLATRTRITKQISVLGALGLAHQAPSFAVPVPGFQPGGLRGGLQKSVQESLGVEVAFPGFAIATATAFHNSFFDMSDPLGAQQREVQGCPPGRFPVDTLAGDRGGQPTGNPGLCGVPRFPEGTLGPDRSGGGGQGADSRGSQNAVRLFETRSVGSAHGLELSVKRRLTQRLGGFLAYTVSRSTRRANGEHFVAAFDRSHVVNAAVAYDLGRNVRMGTRITFYTGVPRATALDGSDDARLAPFFRLDLRLEKRWTFRRNAWLSVVAEWMNATLSKEEVATRCSLRGCEAQTVGPVTIPSVGLEGGF